MSKYTTEVRYICETYYGDDHSSDYDNIENILSSQNVRENIFGDYPIFDEQYRPVLEKKILRHYYTKEIGEESVGLWKLRLNAKMNEIMPYYNKLYQSELLDFNPFYDTDLSTTHSGNENGERNTDEKQNNLHMNSKNYSSSENSNLSNDSVKNDNKESTLANANTNTNFNTKTQTNTSNAEGTKDSATTDKLNHIDKYSDTPQGAIGNLVNDTYLTNARIVEDNKSQGNLESMKNEETGTLNENTHNTSNELGEHNGSEISSSISKDTQSGQKSNNTSESEEGTNHSTNNSTENFRNTEQYLEYVQGKRGVESYSELLIKYRKTFLNIDLQVIEELSGLFFNLW